MSCSPFRMPEPRDLWRHYKEEHNRLYEIVRVVVCTETGEPRVIYHDEGDSNGTWYDRPLSIFIQQMGRDKPSRFTFHSKAGDKN